MIGFASSAGVARKLFRVSVQQHWSAFAAVVLSLFVSAEAGAQPVAVSQHGTPSYAYPVSIPPGIAGLVPHFSLAYNASETNGPVGYGWGLSGTSIITRCNGTLALDGAQRRGVANSPADKLCLDGQRLIQTDESGSATAASNVPGVPVSSQANDAQGLAVGQYREYRIEKDAFARIRAYGIANGSAAYGPAYFKDWTNL